MEENAVLEAKATLRYARISARKVKIVADLIRGKSVAEAEKIVKFGVDENGNATIYWKTLDEKGERCVIYYMHDKYVSFLYLGLKYNHLKVWYDMKPDN